ncbi:MAG: hypothetical protein JWL76_2367 [Thermoleophilia bacterium]|nr:hypothetical protein [Thermoleophilia bacterium]
MTTFLHRIHDARARIDAAVALAAVLTTLCLAVAVGAGIAAATAEPTLPASPPSAGSMPEHAVGMHDHGS